MTIPTFVVGTGRCGSTLISDMLSRHPQILSLSEFFSLITDGPTSPQPFSVEPLDGHGFWADISVVTGFTRFCLQNDLASPEWTYPFDASSSRFSRRSGVPSILLATLSLLSPDADDLFDAIEREVRTWPKRTKGEHYRVLFGWLTNRLGKEVWVERSGAALLWAADLLAIFPEARFVHIVRDGRATALSMHEHPAFRVHFLRSALAQYLGVDPILSSDRSQAARVPEALRKFLPECFDHAAFQAHRPPLALGGTLWSQQIEAGLAVLDRLPGDRLLTLRYEDLFAEPAAWLRSIVAFLGDDVVDEDWIAACAAMVRPPRSTWRDLSADDKRALADACSPGFERLAACGIHYD